MAVNEYFDDKVRQERGSLLLTITPKRGLSQREQALFRTHMENFSNMPSEMFEEEPSTTNPQSIDQKTLDELNADDDTIVTMNGKPVAKLAEGKTYTAYSKGRAAEGKPLRVEVEENIGLSHKETY